MIESGSCQLSMRRYRGIRRQRVEVIGAKRRLMPQLNIFVSFEFDKDNSLKNSFYNDAKKHTQHRIRNCSLKEEYPEEIWKDKARQAIRECDIVVVLIGEDTHNAPGVLVETDMAQSMKKPIIQVRPKRKRYQGVTRLDDPIPWRWKTINRILDELKGA